jgi:hypothetical protein
MANVWSKHSTEQKAASEKTFAAAFGENSALLCDT